MNNSLLLLHGALGSKEQFRELEKLLSGSFQTYSLDFSGHGGLPVPSEPFSIELFAKDVLHFLSETKLDNVNIFGYSMGGYVALYLARHHPEKINRIFTIATKFNWDEEIAAKEIKTLDPSKIEEKIPAFAERLRARHSPEDWKLVLKKSAEMMTNLGRKNTLSDEDYLRIENHVMVGIGDRDKMVTLEETTNVYRKLRNGSLLVMPQTPHPFEEINPGRLKYELENFFK